ncbi:MAG: N-acetylglucosamine-6-phosphate deacetylase [Candidatus Pedobacter colombiensis]|uniref:N-acetylglucosamine-6-phosphate deacetylase n=1 Tax=Candidatus Pedobacter colombiensis TaxID=3121371 RepID=A0AAJ5W961_9SPHI|nr:N-acetylglucosamine-6-phosphate deacetylase [Pedobacter sp.]WEK19451.1 MAG: N-acetylglucosamine-6-phosphate deacetylase [Pedobacter sp.]
MIAITNCKLFKSGVLLTDQSVLIEKGKISRVSNEEVPAGYTQIDARGDFLSPSFVELQIYGSGGQLFSAYPTAETLQQMDDDLIRKGTTGFLACVATNTMEIVYQALDAAKAYRSQAKGFLGLHLEGPYLNPKRRGAHIEAYIHKAELDEVKRLLDHADGTVKMMTLAAELQDDAVINYLLDNDVLLSLGHSDASFEQATAAYNKGFKTTTHLFNAMPAIHHRAPNLPVAVFNHPAAMASIIADGNHVDFEMVKMSHKLMKDRLFLITDAVTECNIGPYQHQLSGDKFITPDGTLSGSNITMLQAVENCVQHCDIPLHDALNMASSYPAKLIGLADKIGSLNVGNDADLLLLTPELKLSKVFVGGLHI